MGIKQIRETVEKKLKCLPKAALYLITAALCVLLMILIGPPDRKKTQQPTEPEINEQSEENYAQELSDRLEEIVSRIQGVGNVSVMLTLENAGEKVYAQDTSESDSKQDAKTVVIGSKEALLKATNYPKVRGVLVVCDGGGKPSVKEKVVNAVATVLDIPTGKVFVTNSK